MLFRTRWLHLAALLASGLALTGKTASADELQDVLNAWRLRDASAGCVRVEWTETITYMRGTRSPNQVRIRQGSTVLPEKDTTVVNQYSLCVQGTRCEFSQRGLQWDSVAEEFTNQTQRESFDGHEARVLTEGCHGLATDANGGLLDECFPSAFLRHYSQPTSYIPFMDAGFAPIFLHFHALNEQVGFLANVTWRLEREPATVDGVDCLVMTEGTETDYQRVYVDPRRFHVIRRWERFFEGELGFQVKCRFSDRDDPPALPREWDGRAMSGSYLLRTWTGKVTEAEINASKVPSFHVEFPVGTEVIEATDHKVSGTYIVMANGERREILPGESGLPYQRLLATQAGEGANGPAAPGSQWAWWIAAVVVGILALLGTYARRRSKRGVVQ